MNYRTVVWRRLGFCALSALLPMACSPGSVEPRATADSVVHAQYAARGPHGAISGDEASRIAGIYAGQIGAPIHQDWSGNQGIGAPDPVAHARQ